MKVRLIELFSGIGAQAKALENLGVDFEHYRSVEIDEKPVEAYNILHGTNFKPQSITDISGSDLGVENLDEYLYIMTYSFPCQDLSVAGQKRGMSEGSGTRSSLLWEVQRLLEEMDEDKRPQVLLMENVTAVHNKLNYNDFMKWHDILEDLGYTSYWFDMNAYDYGVPQSRPRCFMVSFASPQCMFFEPPEPIKLKKTWRDVIDSSIDKSLSSLLIERYKNILPDLNLPQGLSLISASYNPTVCDSYVYCITTRVDRIERLFEKSGGLVVNRDGDDYSVRYVAAKEALMFMGFGVDDYDKLENTFSEAQIYKFAGNSIVVNVLMFIFKAIFDHLDLNDGIEIKYTWRGDN